MRDPVCAIDLFTISDAVLHAKTYSDVIFDVKKFSSSVVLILVPRMLEMAFPSF